MVGGGWGAPGGGAPPAPAPAAPPAQAPAQAPSDPNANIFGTKSLEWQGNENDPSSKTVRLRDRLNEADTERRKEEEAALARERAAEIRREERIRKIEYMQNMPDNEPAGTGKYKFEDYLSFVKMLLSNAIFSPRFSFIVSL